MSIYKMNQYLCNNNSSQLRYRDIIWRELNKKSSEYFQNFDFVSYRDCLLEMHTFILEENRPKTALYLLCEVVSYDLSGLCNGYSQSIDTNKLMIEQRINRFFPYEKSILIIYPGILNYLNKIQEILEMTDKEYREEIRKNLKELETFKSIFTVDEKIEIVFAELDRDTEKLKKIYYIAEQRIKKYVDTLEE